MTTLSEEALLELDRTRGAAEKSAGQGERWFFAWLSAVAHSAGWALISAYTEESSDGIYRQAQVSGNPATLAGAIDLVIQVHALAIRRLAALSGAP